MNSGDSCIIFHYNFFSLQHRFVFCGKSRSFGISPVLNSGSSIYYLCDLGYMTSVSDVLGCRRRKEKKGMLEKKKRGKKTVLQRWEREGW